MVGQRPRAMPELADAFHTRVLRASEPVQHRVVAHSIADWAPCCFQGFRLSGVQTTARCLMEREAIPSVRELWQIAVTYPVET